MNFNRRYLYAMGEPLGESVSRVECGRRVMGSGGGGGGESTTVQSIPDELKPLAANYTQQAMALSNTPYQSFSGDRFADLNSTQQQGLSAMTQQAGSQLPGQASEALSQRISGANPYLEGQIQKASDSVMSNYNTTSVGSGSFGNAGLQEQLAKGLADVNTGLRSADYAQQLQAIGMAPAINQAGYQGSEALLKAGQIQQDQAQQEADFGYQQFQDQQNDPYKKLAAQAGVFNSGLGGTSTTTQSGGGK